jgi:hypothetical protein
MPIPSALHDVPFHAAIDDAANPSIEANEPPTKSFSPLPSGGRRQG